MENEKLNSVEESMRALISKVPDETLEVAAGQLTPLQKKILLGAGVLVTAGATYTGYRYSQSKEGIDSPFGLNSEQSAFLIDELGKKKLNLAKIDGKWQIMNLEGKAVEPLTEKFVKETLSGMDKGLKK